MKLGVSYYPEHWPEERWPEDIRMMKEANINVIRLADFAWSRMEPAEGKFDFDWLDRAISLIEEAGLKVILCTPTAAPPAWLIAKYPEILPADRRKYRLEFGTRMHRCLANPDMRRLSRNITEAMVRHYRDHPAVFAWQIDNELEGNLCYCPVCAQEFHSWLARKYGSLENLNQSWGTVFWSQEYTDWEQVPLPWEARCGFSHNPSLQLDYRRFASDTTFSFLKEQRDIIRKLAPHCIITHDFRGLQNDLDCNRIAPEIDVVSYNNYPYFGTDHDAGITHDFFLGLKQGEFWITEEEAGITGWEVMYHSPEPGLIRLWAWQAIAHGADLISFFRWRSCRFGTEQFWHGILDHNGRKNRRYQEVAGLGKEMRELKDEIEQSIPKRRIAIVNSFDQNWAFEIQPQVENGGFNWWPQVRRIYEGLKSLGAEVDIVPEETDWSGYQLLIFPSWYMVSPEFADRVEKFVASGGTVIFHPRSGVKDMNNVCHVEPLPGLLANILGIEIEEYEPLGTTVTNTIKLFEGKEFKNESWAEVIACQGADALAVHGERYYAGRPALTANRYGLGRAIYLGCLPENGFYPVFFREIFSELHIPYEPNLPDGVEIRTRKAADNTTLYFIYNLTGTTKFLKLNFKRDAKVLLGKELVPHDLKEEADVRKEDAVWQLPPYEIVIIKE